MLAVWGADLEREDVPAFTAFAGQLATAIANTRLHEALRAQMLELSRVQLQLLQSFRLASIGEMAAFVAHEVNNPLTSVVGNLWEVLSDLHPDAPERNRLEVALREGARIGQVVKTLIAHTQRPSPTAEQTSINDVVESALLLFRQRFSLMELDLDLAPSLPPVMGDANELRHVVVSLLSNALDATPEGGRIEVATRLVHRRNQRFVEMTVTDSGRGMSADELAHVFEPFFTTKEMDNRPGLGLAVSKRIIEQHGGSIEAETMPGGGSRFIVLLPVA